MAVRGAHLAGSCRAGAAQGPELQDALVWRPEPAVARLRGGLPLSSPSSPSVPSASSSSSMCEDAGLWPSAPASHHGHQLSAHSQCLHVCAAPCLVPHRGVGQWALPS